MVDSPLNSIETTLDRVRRRSTRILSGSLSGLLDAILEARSEQALRDGHYFAHVARQFVQLGELQYEVSGPIAGLDAQQTTDYAEHAVIEGKPRLQFVGVGLEQLTLTLELHSAYCDPDLELAALRAAAAAHQAMPLVRATGQLRGRYVITQVDETQHQTTIDGALIHASVRVGLKEWVEDQVLEVKTPPRPKRPAQKRSTAATKKPATPATPATPPGDVPLWIMLRDAAVP